MGWGGMIAGGGGENLARMRIAATTLGDMLLNACDMHPDKTAIVFPDGSVTYAELVSRVMARARGLWGLGVRPRQHVGILMPSGIDFVVSVFATAFNRRGQRAHQRRYKGAELGYLAENADLAVILTNSEVSDHTDFAERLAEALPGLADGLPLAATPEAAPCHAVRPANRSRPPRRDAFRGAAAGVPEATIHHARIGVRLRDTCMILYTSGTSSNPKGCMICHEAVVREANNLGRNRWESTPRIASGRRCRSFISRRCWRCCARSTSARPSTANRISRQASSLRQIEEVGATMLFLPFVTFHQAMIAHPDFETTDMSSVKLMNSCFAFMPDAVGATYRRKVPHTLQCGTFGMTEASGIVATGGYAMNRELGFTKLGFPLAGIDRPDRRAGGWRGSAARRARRGG